VVKALDPGVIYEIRMALALTDRVGRTGPADEVLNNALLESLLLHVRILLDFFEHAKDGRERDDVLAEDFSFIARGIALDPDTRRRLNKDLAHLTYESVERPRQAKGWQREAFLPLLARCHEFVVCLKADRSLNLEDETRQQIDHLNTQLASLIMETDTNTRRAT
jgi:hypothetical protein